MSNAANNGMDIPAPVPAIKLIDWLPLNKANSGIAMPCGNSIHCNFMVSISSPCVSLTRTSKTRLFQSLSCTSNSGFGDNSSLTFGMCPSTTIQATTFFSSVRSIPPAGRLIMSKVIGCIPVNSGAVRRISAFPFCEIPYCSSVSINATISTVEVTGFILLLHITSADNVLVSPGATNADESLKFTLDVSISISLEYLQDVPITLVYDCPESSVTLTIDLLSIEESGLNAQPNENTTSKSK